MWSAVRVTLRFLFGIAFWTSGTVFALGALLSLVCLASNDSLAAFHNFLRIWLSCFYVSIVTGFIYNLLDEI